MYPPGQTMDDQELRALKYLHSIRLTGQQLATKDLIHLWETTTIAQQASIHRTIVLLERLEARQIAKHTAIASLIGALGLIGASLFLLDSWMSVGATGDTLLGIGIILFLAGNGWVSISTALFAWAFGAPEPIRGDEP